MDVEYPADWSVRFVANPSRAIIDSIIDGYRLQGWRTTRERLQIVLRYGSSHLLYFGSDDFVAASTIVSVYGNRLWIGFSITHPEHRGRGLFTKLIRFLFEQVVGDPPAVPVYIVCEAERVTKNVALGFDPICRLIKVNVPAQELSPDPAAGSVGSKEAGKKPTRTEIFDLDSRLLGGDRRDKLTSILTEAVVPPQGIWADGLAGYATITRLHGNPHLGPIVATDKALGLDLIRQTLRESARMLGPGSSLEAWVPEPNLDVWMSAGLGSSLAGELHILCRGETVGIASQDGSGPQGGKSLRPVTPREFFDSQLALYGGGTG